MGAAKKAKALGFKNLNQVAEYSGWSRASLDKMSVNHPERFETALFGAKVKMDSLSDKDDKLLYAWKQLIKYSCNCGKISEVREFTNGEMPKMINIADFKDPNDPEGRSYREINNATEHRFKVGQLVELDDGVRLFVAKQTRDCDGTPLYCLTPKKGDYEQQREGFANYNWVNGYPCDSLKAV